jgi:cytochrome c oxidase subunit 2
VNRSRAPLAIAISVAVLAVVWFYYSLNSPPTPQSTFYPESEFARSTHGVYSFINILLLIIFVVVESALVWVLFRFRKDDAKRGDPLPDQVHGNTKIEVFLTLATTTLVIVLFVPSCQQIQYAQGPAPADPLMVEVTGRQWWWEFYYPEFDLVTANEIHLPVGRTVQFNLTSADVIHAFWIPRLGGKRDNVPGRTQHFWLTPEKEEVYDGQCAEFCGTSHALMSMQVVTEAPEKFQAWVRQQKAANPAAMGGIPLLAQAGCLTCHTTIANDKSVLGQQGPNLAKVGSRRMIAAGVLPNTPENLTRWISDSQHLKPAAKMDIPAAQCTAEDVPDPCCRREGIGNCLPADTVAQLVSYLSELK